MCNPRSFCQYLLISLILALCSVSVTAQVLSPSVSNRIDKRRALQNGSLYHATINCGTGGRNITSIQNRLRTSSSKRRLNVTTYVLMLGITGIYPEGKIAPDNSTVKLIDDAGQPLTKVIVGPLTLAPIVAPVLVRSKGQNIVEISYLNRVPCERSFYFRYEKDKPAMATWAEFATNKGRAKVIQRVLTPGAKVIDGVLTAAFDKTLPGLGKSTDISAFSTALDEIFEAFDKNVLSSGAVVFQLGQNSIESAGLSVTVEITAPDHLGDGTPLGLVDNSFLTGKTRFSSTWSDFLDGGAASLLRETARGNVEGMAQCSTIAQKLRGSGEYVRLSETDAAFVMLASMKGGAVSANNAFACLNEKLACASRDFTDPKKARRSQGVVNVTKRAIEPQFYFERSIPSINLICANLDAKRDNKGVVEALKAIKAAEEAAERSAIAAAEAARIVVEKKVKNEVLFVKAKAHSEGAWRFFKKDNRGKSRLDKFRNLANFIANLPEPALAGFAPSMNKLGTETVEAVVPVSFVGELYTRRSNLVDRAVVDSMSAADRAKEKAQLDQINKYFGTDIWEVEPPAIAKQPLSFLVRAMSIYGLKHFGCYHAYNLDDVLDGVVVDSPIMKLFGDHSDDVELPHFLILAFKSKPKNQANLKEGYVIHGFVEENRIKRLAVNWNDSISVETVIEVMRNAGVGNSCVKLVEEKPLGKTD